MSDTIEARFTTVLNTNERLKRELSAAKAEVARLTRTLVWIAYKPEPDAPDYTKAEIARLTKITDEQVERACAQYHSAWDMFDARTKAFHRDEFRLAIEAALKPDTGE